MKRDELKQLLEDCHEEIAYGAPVHKRLVAALAWLERLPAGCELVGLDGMVRDVGAVGGTLPSEPGVYDTEMARGVGRYYRAMFINPDDLTKAGKR